MKFNIQTNTYAVKNSLMKPEEKFKISMLVAENEEAKFLNEEFVAEGFRYSDIDVDEKDYEKKIDLPEILKLD